MNRPSISRPGRTLVLLAVVSVTCGLYVMAFNRSLTEDSCSYAYSGLTGEDLFHPHHLLFNPVLWTFSRLGEAFSATVATRLAIFRLLGLACTLGTVVVFWLIAHRLSGDAVSASAFALLLAFSYGFFSYSAQIEVYTPTALFLSLALYGLIPAAGPGRPASFVGVCYFLAMSFHQTAIFFVLPLMVVLLTAPPGRGRRGDLLRHVVLPLVAIAAVYLLIGGLTGHTTPDAFSAWVTQFAHSGYFGGALSTMSILEAAWGLTKALIPAERVAAPWNLVLAGGFLLSMSVHVLLNLRRVRAWWQQPGGILMFQVLWFLPLAAFALWWFPLNREFWIVPTVPLLLFLFLVNVDPGARPAVQRSSWISWTILPGWILLFGAGDILTALADRPEAEEIRSEMEGLADSVADGDCILTANTYAAARYQLFALPARVKVVAVNDDLARRAGRRGDAGSLARGLVAEIREIVGQAEQRDRTCFVDRRLCLGRVPVERDTARLDRDELDRLMREVFDLSDCSSSEPHSLHELRLRAAPELGRAPHDVPHGALR